MLNWVNEAIRAEFPGKLLIAEDMHRDERITQVDADGAAFHAQWDSSFVHPVREAVITADDADRSMAEVIAAVGQRYNDDAFQRVIYTGVPRRGRQQPDAGALGDRRGGPPRAGMPRSGPPSGRPWC